MVLVGYEDVFSFNGDFNYTMLIVENGKTISLASTFKWISMDNFVDKREVYESVIANIEDKNNLKDIFIYRFNILDKTKTTESDVSGKANLTITYYDSRFEKHIPFLINTYRNEFSKGVDVKLVFEYAPYDKAYIDKNEFIDFMKEAYGMPEEDIQNIINELSKGE